MYTRESASSESMHDSGGGETSSANIVVAMGIAAPMKPAAAPPHILLVSLPAPGHLFPFTNFAYQLAAAGAQVTCLTTGHVFEDLQHRSNHRFVQNATTNTNNMVRFEGLLENNRVVEVNIENMVEWLQELSHEEMEEALEQRIRKLKPKPCCIVGDMFLPWVQHVANKLEIPWHTLLTMPAVNLAFVLRVPDLMEQGKLPLAAGDKEDISLPGMAPIHADDVWDAFHEGYIYPERTALLNAAFISMRECSCIFVNTLEELEEETLKALRIDFVAANIKVPEVLAIGPLLSEIPRMRHRSNREEDDVLLEVEKFLDSQASGSVIYISFGSVLTLPEKQIGKLALALEATHYPFLWVFRPPGIPQVNKSASPHKTQDFFPPGFQERISGRAMVINGWAPQPQILAHEATGAFLSHCGWNSTLESICWGVPVLGWPIWADQMLNARLITDIAQVGLRIHTTVDNTVEQEEIEKMLKQMMEGEEGKAARSRARKFQELAAAKHTTAGASSMEKIVHRCYAAI